MGGLVEKQKYTSPTQGTVEAFFAPFSWKLKRCERVDITKMKSTCLIRKLYIFFCN